MYIVNVGYRRNVKFKTEEEAINFCNEVFDKTKIILNIEHKEDIYKTK